MNDIINIRTILNRKSAIVLDKKPTMLYNINAWQSPAARRCAADFSGTVAILQNEPAARRKDNAMLYKLSLSAGQPHCICFGRFMQTNGWNHRGKTAMRNLLLIFTGGSAKFNIEGTEYDVSRGYELLIPAGSRYFAYTDTSCEYYFLHFSDELTSVSEHPSEKLMLRRSIEVAAQKIPDCFLADVCNIDDEYTQILMLLIEMEHLRLIAKSEEQYMFQLDFIRLLITLSSMTRAFTEQKNELSERVRTYISENITAPLTLSALSEHFGVSKSYLLRLFKRDCQTSVTAYINASKLDLAAELLHSSMMNVSEVAYHLGYSDVGYFSRIFRKRFGIPPSSLK